LKRSLSNISGTLIPLEEEAPFSSSGREVERTPESGNYDTLIGGEGVLTDAGRRKERGKKHRKMRLPGDGTLTDDDGYCIAV